MCAPRVTRHTSRRYSRSCHTRFNMGASIFFTAAMIHAFRSARSRGNVGTDHCSSEEYWCTHVDVCVPRTWISYWCVLCHPWCTHRTSLVVKRTFSVFLWLWTIPYGRSFDSFVISVWYCREHYEMPCISFMLFYQSCTSVAWSCVTWILPLLHAAAVSIVSHLTWLLTENANTVL
jgi:hypothetical protein